MEKPKSEFLEEPYLQDIVERNLEVAAQAILDLSHRIISQTGAEPPEDYRDAILKMGELGIVPGKFAEKMAPLAGFRNILIHEYTSLDWDIVYDHLQRLDELETFHQYFTDWLEKHTEGNT
jgi:uncharacterized protein YutE (UPF0331/DUF86 family)